MITTTYDAELAASSGIREHFGCRLLRGDQAEV
jgi:hypothetical protein